jgi:hypothetical protein
MAMKETPQNREFPRFDQPVIPQNAAHWGSRNAVQRVAEEMRGVVPKGQPQKGPHNGVCRGPVATRPLPTGVARIERISAHPNW